MKRHLVLFWFVLTVSIIICAYLTEYYKAHVELLAVRESARSLNLPEECSDLIESNPHERNGSLMNYFMLSKMFNLRMDASQREICRKLIEERFIRINSSVYPNPLIVFVNMCSRVVFDPIWVFADTIGRACHSFIQSQSSWLEVSVSIIICAILYGIWLRRPSRYQTTDQRPYGYLGPAVDDDRLPNNRSCSGPNQLGNPLLLFPAIAADATAGDELATVLVSKDGNIWE